jgi:hypothetical protein
MNCFRHRGSAATGLCLCCGRAICPDCTREINEISIACSDACAAEMLKNQELVAANRRHAGVGVSPARFPTGTLTWGLMGVFFVGFGIYSSYRGSEFMAIYTTFFGVMCWILAGVVYWRNSARAKPVSDHPANSRSL